MNLSATTLISNTASISSGSQKSCAVDLQGVAYCWLTADLEAALSPAPGFIGPPVKVFPP
jgi:hypothetical protein